MATSGTFTFAPTADGLLTEAWERLGRSASELNGDVARSARASLQYMADDWTNRGHNLWQMEKVTLTLAAGTASYTLDASTIEPLDVFVTVAGVDRPLAPIGRSTYAAIPVKTLQSVPTQFWCNRANPQPVLFLYPVPNQAYTLTYWRLRLAQDVTTLGQNLDAPRLWSDALAAGLAARLAEKYAPEREDKMAAKAEAALLRATTENRQRGPLRLDVRFRR